MTPSFLSFGNSKLDKSVAVFNIRAAHDCLWRNTKFCQVTQFKKQGYHGCYALKAERQYPQVLPFRRRQSEVFFTHYTSNNPEGLAGILMAHFRKTTKLLRWNGSGDFYGRDEWLFAKEVMRYIYEATGVISFGYTCCPDVRANELMSDYHRFRLSYSPAPGETANFYRFSCVTPGNWMTGENFCPHSKQYKGAFKHMKCGYDCRKCLDPSIKAINIENH